MTQYAPPDDIRASARAYLEEASPAAEVRRLMETPDGFDRTWWKQVAADLGLQGLGVPTRYGGSGRPFRDVAIAFEEMGRVLLCAPFLSTVALATSVLLCSADDEVKARLLPSIAAGELLATVAFTEDSGRWDDTGVTATAARRGEMWFLNGQKSFVLDGCAADVLLVAARMGDGVSLFEVDADAVGLNRQPLPTMDQTRRLARVELMSTRARLIGRKGGGWEVLRRATDLALVALAAEQVGGAQRCLELAVAHVKSRNQFGRPVGSFQAVKHACADMLVAVESARAAAAHATTVAAEVAPGDGPGGVAARTELPVAASMAKACCSEAYTAVADATVHLHGALGCTWDHDAHLYLKRAKSSELLFGDPAFHRSRIGDCLGL